MESLIASCGISSGSTFAAAGAAVGVAAAADGAGEKRPYVINDSLQIATMMSATGSFDHRAIDGADGARLMQAFKRLVENPLGMLA